MHVETTVAVITQTLRLNACLDFINSVGDDTAVTIFTGDPGAFNSAELPEGTSIMSASAPEPLLTDTVRLRRVGRRRLLEWMRSGSGIGRFSEKAARKLLGLVRPVKEPESQQPGSVADQPTNAYLIEQLDSLHAAGTLSTIAVFDVFDLPTVLEFSTRSGVRVIVR